MRWLLRLALGSCILLALAVAAGVLVEVQSTRMIWRKLTGLPVERTWMPLEAMSPYLREAVIAAEDQRFCTHHGVDWGAVREVLTDEDGPRRGASTITMQTVKNVYLWHGRSMVRKALELPLALVVDLAWSKRRIMEVYLNVAEFGDGLFGAEAAAKRYFGKAAAALTRAEAARLAAALPNPLLRNPARPSSRAQTNALMTMRRMAALGNRTDCVR